MTLEKQVSSLSPASRRDLQMRPNQYEVGPPPVGLGFIYSPFVVDVGMGCQVKK